MVYRRSDRFSIYQIPLQEGRVLTESQENNHLYRFLFDVEGVMPNWLINPSLTFEVPLKSGNIVSVGEVEGLASADLLAHEAGKK
ncbi:hypothetical protein OUZ56_000291 [Daphnia magna]|uniref:Uncharacterized protein n=1 Tax=Daphnia magna TaxID=35525 RepID=A0ABQ9ZZ88_9CRUS|nr:hypothetical protein OUZ56_000291 [Daphnia magna]